MAFEYDQFCRELVSDWDDLFVDVEVCGSFSELPLPYIANNVTDTDVMLSLKDIEATSDGLPRMWEGIQTLEKVR